MSKPKLTYFDFNGSRGEECRLAFAVAGVDFEDHRVVRGDWALLKTTTPFGSMPVLEIEGKPPLSQSNAILGYIGRRHGLLPKNDEWEAARLESLLSAAEDLRHAVSRTFGINDPDELRRVRQELVQGPILTWAANMEKQIVGPYASGEAISVADIKVFIVMGWLKNGVLDHVPRDVLTPFPKLQKLYQSVETHPKVAGWYARTR